MSRRATTRAGREAARLQAKVREAWDRGREWLAALASGDLDLALARKRKTEQAVDRALLELARLTRRQERRELARLARRQARRRRVPTARARGR